MQKNISGLSAILIIIFFAAISMALILWFGEEAGKELAAISASVTSF